MSHNLFLLALASLSLCAMQSYAQEELNIENVLDMGEEYPVGCMVAEMPRECYSAFTTTRTIGTRGVEIQTIGTAAEPGTYLHITVSSVFDVRDNAICYRDIASDYREAQFVITHSLQIKPDGAVRHPTAEGKAYFQKVALDPMADSLEGVEICVKYYRSWPGFDPDAIVVQAYADGEEFEEPGEIVFYEAGAESSLTLIDIAAQ